MSDNYRLDQHKLIFHPDWVAQWQKAYGNWELEKKIYPLYVELSPSGSCNHRCLFCAYDYIGYRKEFFSLSAAERVFQEMSGMGVKSMLFSGEGEPLLHKDFSQLAQAAFSSGIDIALATNGVLLREEFINFSLGLFKWIKISIAAGRPETYAMIHRTGSSDFGNVFANLHRAVQRKKEKGFSTVIGAQLLALPENVDEVLELAELCDRTGLDYLVVKPFSQNGLSLNSCYRDIDYNGLMAKLQKIEYKSDSDFRLIIRYQSITRAAVEENIYNICRAVPYAWCHIMTNGDVYACGAWLGDWRFLLGNVNENGFAEIWEGDRRREVIEMMRTFSTGVCRINCRMSQINEYLHQLQNPGAHVNFI